MSKAFNRGSDLAPVEREAIAWVQKLTSGEAKPEDIDAFKRWQQESPAHDAAFADAKRVWDGAGAAGRMLHESKEELVAELDALGRKRKAINRRAVVGGGVAALAAATVYGAINPPL